MLKKFFLNLKLNRKILIILVSEALIFSTLGMSALQLTFYIYDMQLHDNVEKVLNMYSVNIENKLDEISTLSYTILKDKQMQNNLQQLKTKESSYKEFVASNNINKMLETWYSSMNKLLLAIQIFDANGVEYSRGQKAFRLEDAKKDEIIKKAHMLSGGNIWVEPTGTDNSIILARTIRLIDNLDLGTLGTLIMRVDPQELIKLYSDFLPQYDSSIYIVSAQKVILGKDINFDFKSLLPFMNKKEGYFITDIQKKKDLVVYRKSIDTDWTFINIVPYESIYKKITAVRIIVILSYVGVLIILIFLGFKFTRSITKPIEKLTDEMKVIESGKFEDINFMESYDNNRKDEIGQLHQDFRIMLMEINSLIKENYVKQIQVKEFEYKALQAQINPHFLYNTLDSINWLAKVNNQKHIAVMVKSLGDLLRNSISKKDPVITIREEFKILNDYITIQKIRYEERLDIVINVGEEILDCFISKFTFQPIVENSINYGLEKDPGLCRIVINAKILHNTIEISLSDNGPGISPEMLVSLKRGEIQSKGSGIGLNNISDRIKLLFGEQYGLEVDSIEHEGTTVKVIIPFKNTHDQL